MTSKKELRDALQAIDDWFRATTPRSLNDIMDEARALLARPAQVVGYINRGGKASSWVEWRPSGCSIDECRTMAHEYHGKFGGKLYRLVVR